MDVILNNDPEVLSVVFSAVGNYVKLRKQEQTEELLLETLHFIVKCFTMQYTIKIHRKENFRLTIFTRNIYPQIFIAINALFPSESIALEWQEYK